MRIGDLLKMSVMVRVAAPADKSRCLELIGMLTGQSADPGWGRAYDELMRGRRGTVLVAVEEQREEQSILGVATLSYNLAVRYSGEYCQLEELIVDDAARGKNAGGLLVQAAVDAARAHGCAEMGLYLVERTEGNRAFYAKYGFAVVGTEMRQRL